MNFTDSITEYRYFDNNSKPITDKKNASIIIAFADNSYFGKYWFALDRGGYSIGQATTINSALKIGSTRVISDRASKIDIEIKRGDISRSGKYSQDVFVDGKCVASFRPHGFSRGYYLRDLSDIGINYIGEGHHRHHIADVTKQSEMEDTVRRWFEFIPTQGDLHKRDMLEAAEKDRKQREELEAQRVFKIQQNGVELLQSLTDMIEFYDDGMETGPAETARKLIKELS